MKILFLHGVRGGNVKDAWFHALCDALDKLGYQRPDADDVIAPDYAAVLMDKLPFECQPPPLTAPPLGEEEAARLEREYARRLGALERLLADTESPPDPVEFPESLVQAALALPFPNLKQASNYVNNDNLRCRVLRRVLRELNASGDLVIVGHSLGSLIAIDLLDHLPGGITVQRLVTIGSPAGHRVLHGKTNRLVRKFPISRVRSWANLWSARDPVCYGRGIAHHFPQALDVRIDLRICEHDAEAYLRNDKVGTAVGEALFGSLLREIVPLQTAVDVPLNEQEKFALAALVYAHHLSKQLKDDRPRQERFRAALAEVQQSLIDIVVERCRSEQRAMPAEFSEIICELAEGRYKKTARDVRYAASDSRNVDPPEREHYCAV